MASAPAAGNEIVVSDQGGEIVRSAGNEVVCSADGGEVVCSAGNEIVRSASNEVVRFQDNGAALDPFLLRCPHKRRT